MTASVGGHVCSASYDPITCSRTALATTRARSKSAIAAGTSWCRCQGSGTSMISTRILKPAAPSDRNNCVATTRRSANASGSCGSSAPSRNRLRRLRQAPGAGQFAVAGALSRHRLLRPHTVRPLRGAGPRLCPRGGHQLRRRGDCQAPAFIRAFVFDPLHYLALLEQKTNALDQAARSADGQSRRPGAAANRELLPRRCSSRHIGGAGARRDRLRCGQATRSGRHAPAGPSLSAARRGGQPRPARTWGS